jgi:hypothetical protein
MYPHSGRGGEIVCFTAEKIPRQEKDETRQEQNQEERNDQYKTRQHTVLKKPDQDKGNIYNRYKDNKHNTR